MSQFTSKFENKQLKVAHCLDARFYKKVKGKKEREIIYEHVVLEPLFYDTIRLYAVNGDFNFTVGKEQLLNAINHCWIFGEVVN